MAAGCHILPVSNKAFSFLVSSESVCFRGTCTYELTSQLPPHQYALSFRISGLSLDGSWTQKYRCTKLGGTVTDKLRSHLPQRSTKLGRIPVCART